MTKKELREPDAFQRAGAEARSWLVERQKIVLAVVVGVLLVSGGVAFANFLSTRREEQAAKALSEALKPLDRPVEAQASARPNSDDPPFKSEKEKNEAIQKSLTDFRSQHKGTRSALTAGLALAQVEFKLGNYDQALAGYQEYMRGAPSEDPLRVTALEGAGYAHEAKGELDQALALFDQLSKENQTEFMKGMGLFHQGRILVLQNKKEEAAKRFSEITDAAPDSAAARSAKERLAVLASEGIKPPPKAAPAAATPDAG